MSTMEINNVIEFLELVGKLKHTKRTGWVIKDVNDPECIAGHMYRMAMITFLLNSKDELDIKKCLQMALVHDLAESIVGDITPYCGVSEVDKHEMEDEAMKKIISLLGNHQGDYIYKLYKEYEERQTKEAIFVKELDRFDMILQAYEYEKKEKRPGTLQEFFDSTKGKFAHPLLKNMADELDKRREEMADKPVQ